VRSRRDGDPRLAAAAVLGLGLEAAEHGWGMRARGLGSHLWGGETLGMRAQARAVARIPAESCTAVVEGKAEEGKEELTHGAKLPERKERGRARRVLGEEVAPTGGPELTVEGKRGGARGGAGWLLGRASPRGKEEEGKRWAAGGRGWAEREVWAGLPSSFLSFFFFSFPFPHSNHSNHSI
jgi:hypothetical protein